MTMSLDRLSLLSCLTVTIICGVMMSALPAMAQTVIHCWDFNGTASGGNFITSPIAVDNRVAGNGTITHTFSAVEDFTGNVDNGCEGSVAGAAFSPQHGAMENNNGQSFTLDFPTTCYEDLTFSFWVRRSNTGFESVTVAYSPDAGATWTDLTPFDPTISSGGEVVSFDLSSITAANNNPQFRLRITVDGSTSTTTGANMGNTRFDNIKLEGDPISIGVMALASSETICPGEGTVLTGSGALSYTWDNNVVDGETVFPSQTTTYTVIGTNGNGCEGTADVTVTVYQPNPVTISTSGPTVLCQGDDVTLSVTGGITYAWSNGGAGASILVSDEGDYSVEVTDANGCDVTSNTVSVTVNDLPTVVITPDGPTEFCAGGSVQLTATAASQYAWSTGETGQSITVTADDSYSVTITDGNGCSNTSVDLEVTVNDLPDATIVADGPVTFCEGGDVAISVNTATAYAWSTGGTDQSIIVDASGDISVQVTGPTGCTATSQVISVVVNVPTTPVITANGPVSFCEGGSVTLTASVGSQYQWSSGATDQSIVVEDAGDQDVTVTDSNGCTATSDVVSVEVYDLPVASSTPDGPLQFCDGGSVQLTASTAVSYTWSTGDTGPSIDVVDADSYTVTVTDGNGCSATSNVVTVVVNDLPVVSITPDGPLELCSGGSVELTASAGVTYSWSTGETGQSIVVEDADSYNVTVTDGNGCTATSDDAVVQVNETVAPIVEQQGNTLVVANGPYDAYQWYVNGTPVSNATTAIFSPSAADTYTVVVTDGTTGCDAESAPFAFSPIVSVLETPAGMDFEVYPNPTDGPVTLLFGHETTAPMAIRIVDAAGRVIRTSQLAQGMSSVTIALDALETGVYMVQMMSTEGRESVQMVMKR